MYGYSTYTLNLGSLAICQAAKESPRSDRIIGLLLMDFQGIRIALIINICK